MNAYLQEICRKGEVGALIQHRNFLIDSQQFEYNKLKMLYEQNDYQAVGKTWKDIKTTDDKIVAADDAIHELLAKYRAQSNPSGTQPAS